MSTGQEDEAERKAPSLPSDAYPALPAGRGAIHFQPRFQTQVTLTSFYMIPHLLNFIIFSLMGRGDVTGEVYLRKGEIEVSRRTRLTRAFSPQSRGRGGHEQRDGCFLPLPTCTSPVPAVHTGHVQSSLAAQMNKSMAVVWIPA